MFDPYAQGNPWMQAGWGGQPYGFGSQSLFSTPFGFGNTPQHLQFGSPGYFPGTSPIAPQTWFGHPLGSMPFGQPLNPILQQVVQQIPQLVQNAHQLAQQVPQLIQQIPQLLQQNPQLIQQVPQLQQVPQFLQQAAVLAHQIPQVLQALVSQSPTQGGTFGVPYGAPRPFGYGQIA